MRRLIAIGVVLVALFVLADRLTLLYAENRIADELKSTEGLASTPDVNVRGFPFLTQVVAGDYSDIEVVISDYAPAHAIAFDRIDVHLHDAHLPMSDALAGNADRVPVRHVDGTAVIGYDAFKNV